MNRQIFDTYVETQLAPTLQPGDVVIPDNLASHKSAKAEAILKQRGAWFLFSRSTSESAGRVSDSTRAKRSQRFAGNSQHARSSSNKLPNPQFWQIRTLGSAE
jgi:hypothetical protein